MLLVSYKSEYYKHVHMLEMQVESVVTGESMSSRFQFPQVLQRAPISTVIYPCHLHCCWTQILHSTTYPPEVIVAKLVDSVPCIRWI